MIQCFITLLQHEEYNEVVNTINIQVGVGVGGRESIGDRGGSVGE